MIHAKTILVIIGSTRAQRIGPQVAGWVAEIGREGLPSARFEVVDLKDWPLPMDDEPGVPAGHPYVFEHTKAWSRKISEGDGVVFVTPQYNWGYPAPLKNAIDHLYKEWAGKPAMIVTYGGHGGDRCAAQLRQVLEAVHLAPVATMPAFTLPRARIEANDGIVDPPVAFAGSEGVLRQAFAELATAILPPSPTG
jgi:NAD(P)H-dependent FMN reductase